MINIEWRKDTLVLLDQTKLPTEITYVHCTDWRQVPKLLKCFAFVAHLLLA